MRSFSYFTIVLLCMAILLVDIFAFYWLLSITKPIDQIFIKNSIYIAFWIFTIGLITSILILKVRMDDIDPRRKQLLVSSLYGLTVSSLLSFMSPNYKGTLLVKQDDPRIDSDFINYNSPKGGGTIKGLLSKPKNN